MKRHVVAALLLAGAVAAFATGAFALGTVDDPVPVLRNVESQHRVPGGPPPSPRASTGADPDTVFVGYSRVDHWNATNNNWNLWSGTRRPGTNDANNAIWDWDDGSILAAHGVHDSLAGWWPDLRLYNSTGGYTLPDHQRPWWAIDYGNTANYVINQGAGSRRTCGLVGVWHADGGSSQPGGSGVRWAPLSGTRSAWCGLRQLNDHSVLDAVTGQPFNQAAVERVSGGGNAFAVSPRTYPGYASQWDQLLYRDVAAPGGAPLALSFLYRTRLSTDYDPAAATRTGWFHGDPLSVTAGNFISSSAAGANAPRDSFMVYVGVPVDDAHCRYSDGSVGAVYDPQRRWFSEVLRLFGGAPYFEIFAAAGCHPADTAEASPLASLTVPAADVDAIRDAPGNDGHLVRLVFRVKTNRGSSDDDGFDSASRGAALVDDVTVNGEVIGDFELPEQGGPNAIDNRAVASPLTHWKSTGKPPPVYAHLDNLQAGFNYNEMCGAWDDPARHCDIRGNYLTFGEDDLYECLMDPRYAAWGEGFPGIWSPTVNLVVARDGSNAVNPHGLTESVVTASRGIHLTFDVYAGQLNLPFTGVGYWPACQVYPVRQSNNGAAVWSDPLTTSFFVFDPDPQCFGDWYDLDEDIGLPTLANSYNRPDSLRVWIGIYQACFRFGVSLNCNDNDGVYFDNVSLAFVDDPASPANAAAAIEPGAIALRPWEAIADAFPANETPLLPNSANFDTTTALIVGPRNVAQATGNPLRFCIQPDTVLVVGPDVAGPADPVFGHATRMDLVFRILPGPGNYAVASPGGRMFPPTASMQLLDVPTNQSNLVSPGDGTFWGEYLADPGAFSAGDHHGHTRWDHLTWNSARCDTAEVNVFPVAGRISCGVTPGTWANMLHESDPRYAVLGVTRFRCFMLDTAGAAANDNIRCDGTIPAWLSAVPRERTGWDGETTTREFTKVIPDGLLTPGSHVQYFWRKSALADPANTRALVPDTNQVFQPGEWSTDGHRWQQFGILPDRWKDVAFGGAGMACMLYVDWNDPRGNERVFVSVADSNCATLPAKFGAHNGWSAPGIAGATMADLARYPVVGKNEQPGHSWDMVGVRAAESGPAGAVSLGSRLANRAAMGYATGKHARTGPTSEMLRRFYRRLTVSTGDLSSMITGPFLDKSQDDIGILNDFLTGNGPGSTAQPRGIFVGGDGFVQSEDLLNGQNASHGSFLSTRLGLTLRNGAYSAVSGNTYRCADLVTTSVITSNGDVCGVGNGCASSNDLLQRNPSITEAQEAVYYEEVGANGPYVAAVHKPSTASRPWVAYTEGWDIEHLWGRYCETAHGRLRYYGILDDAIFATQCQWTVPLLCYPLLDVPSAAGARSGAFLKIGNSVACAGGARLRFGVAAPDRVRIRLYDVAGRLVRTLADRTFAAGEHELVWDGTEDGGRRVPSGVYFARVEYTSAGRGIHGRVVLLK